MNDKQLEKALTRAKVQLTLKSQAQFLAYLVFSLPITFSDEVPTGATDGKRILLNPVFFTGLSTEEQQFLLAHELMHIVLHHITRLQGRDMRIFNYAGDYVINLELQKQGFKLIKGALYNIRYDGMTTEQVYELIKDEANDLPNNSIGLDIEYDNSQQTKQEIDSIISKAVMQADMAGASNSVPDSIRRYLKELTKPKVNWKILLRKYLLALDKSDYSWARPRRQLITQGLYLPHLRSYGLDKISFAIDTSGSIDNKQFNQFMSEVAYVLSMMKPKQIDLLQFDHVLRSHDTISSIRDIQRIDLQGGGGTLPETALIAVNQTNSKAVFVITDGYFASKEIPKPKQPVIWVVFDNKHFQAPFGDTIHINLE